MNHYCNRLVRRFGVAITIMLSLILTATLFGAAPAQAMDGRNPDARAATPGGEISAMYWHGLNRDPDSGGLATYLPFTQENCAWGTMDASYRILTSPEAHAVWRDDPQTLAGMLFAALLNRPPDAGGVETYTTAIRGRGLEWATAAMMGSAEYRNRLFRLCPDWNAAMYSWQDARTFADEVLFKRAATLGLQCKLTSWSLDKLKSLRNGKNTYVAIAGMSATVVDELVEDARLDGTCDAAASYMKAGAEVYRMTGYGKYNPVFIQFDYDSNSGWNPLDSQRQFAVRVGPNPTHWNPFAGQSWG